MSTIWTGSGRCARASAWRLRRTCCSTAPAGLHSARSSIRAPSTVPASTSMATSFLPLMCSATARCVRAGPQAAGWKRISAAIGPARSNISTLTSATIRRRSHRSTPLTIAFNSRITEDMVRVGLNYKFDPYVVYVPVYPTPPAPVLERVRPVYKAPMQAVWTWTGFYFGANAGYATGSFDTSTLYSDAWMGTPLFGAQSSARLKGGIGGAQTGYNLQSGIWFAGLETDLQFATQRNITTSLCPGAVGNPGLPVDTPITVDHSHSLDWFGTVRGRLGVAFTPDLVAYGTAGLAVGGIEHSASIAIGGVTAGIDAAGNPTGTPMTFTTRSTKTGYAVGGGIETHLGGNVTGKIEYLHMSFGTDHGIGSTNTHNTPPTAIAFASKVTDDIVRLGLNYKFDPNGADAPVYQPAAR